MFCLQITRSIKNNRKLVNSFTLLLYLTYHYLCQSSFLYIQKKKFSHCKIQNKVNIHSLMLSFSWLFYFLWIINRQNQKSKKCCQLACIKVLLSMAVMIISSFSPLCLFNNELFFYFCTTSVITFLAFILNTSTRIFDWFRYKLYEYKMWYKQSLRLSFLFVCAINKSKFEWCKQPITFMPILTSPSPHFCIQQKWLQINSYYKRNCPMMNTMQLKKKKKGMSTKG